MTAVKELCERRRPQQIGDKDIFYIFPLFLGSTTIHWLRKFFLNTNEMVESPSQGDKNALTVSYSVFKALKMCLVYKTLVLVFSWVYKSKFGI